MAESSSSSSAAGRLRFLPHISSRRLGGAASIGTSASTVPSEGVSQESMPPLKPRSSSCAAFGRAHRRRGRAEHDRDQAFAVAGCRSDEIEARRADEAGLHAVGALDSGRSACCSCASMRLPNLIAGCANRCSYSGISRIHRAGEDRQVARRGDLELRWQPVGVDEARLRHAEPARGAVHLVGELLDRPGHALGEHDRDVVRRLHHQHLERIVDGDRGADAKPILLGACAAAFAETVSSESRARRRSLTARRVT